MATTTTSAPLAAGTRLAHYEVREVLGTGGMGTVYLGYDTALDRLVAVKVLKSEVAGDADLVDRFVREARAAARVSHPNLTHVYFVGTEDGKPFFAMEHCSGTTLEARVKDRGPLGLTEGIDVLVQAAKGLSAVHAVGVVHRDVKPSNLMLLPDGTVKVTDFGLSKSLSGDVQATAGRIMGTPAYMTPEQVRGKPVDARTDIYLLALSAHYLFTGKPAFASEQIGEVIHDQMNSPLPAVTDARPDFPTALDEVLGRMGAKDPGERPATMAEVLAMLEGLRPRPLNPAALVARGAAYTIDWALLLLLAVASLSLDKIPFMGGTPAFVQSLILAGAGVALLLLPEMRWGTTAGKSALNLGVVRADGVRAGKGMLVLRFALRYPVLLAISPTKEWNVVDATGFALQGLTVGVGVVCYFVTQGRTLSDLITRTRVVYRLPGGGPGAKAPPAPARR
jgi:uncharacterized RDD family membrane protein YckC